MNQYNKFKKTNKHYIKAKDFHNEYNLSLQQNKPTDKLLKMFFMIAERYSSKFNNLCDTDANSCINYAATEAYYKWKEYDINKSENIFAFFTQMIKNDLTAHYNLINKNSYRNVSIDAIFINNQDR